MKIAVLIADGPNEVEITSMVFSSIEKGLAKVKEITGKDMEFSHGQKEWRLDIADLLEKEADIEKELYKKFRSNKDDDNIHEKVYKEKERLGHTCLTNKLFTYYNGGCGEMWNLRLKEVEEGTPFCCFDLD
jgi:dTDP-glucose pyrophosphorylase